MAGHSGTARVTHLRSTWTLQASPVEVWSVLASAQEWSRWWPGLTSTVVKAGNPDGVGTAGDLTFASPLGYRLRLGLEVTSSSPPQEVGTRRVGDRIGTAHARLLGYRDSTIVIIDWRVHLNRPVLAQAERVVPRVMHWAHHEVMRAGERGLRAHLAAEGGRTEESTHR
mgnify:CR=1 FL=1